MLKEFRDFVMRGNVVELAVAVIIGAAFGAVITAFTAAFITPLIALIGGKPDFAGLRFIISGTAFPYGQFLNALISFLIIAAVVFFLVVPRGVRSNHPAVPGLGCSIIGLLLVFPAFWSGLPIVLGAAGFVLGQAGRGSRRATGGWYALGAIVVGIAAVVLNLLALLLDRLA